MELLCVLWLFVLCGYVWALNAKVQNLSDQLETLQHEHDELKRICRLQFGYWTIG